MSKLKNSYCFETEHFFNNNNSNIHPETPYHNSKSQTCLVFKFSLKKNFCTKPTLLYITLYFEPSITYEDGFNMHTGQRNPLQLPEDEQYDRFSTQFISGKLVQI